MARTSSHHAGSDAQLWLVGNQAVGNLYYLRWGQCALNDAVRTWETRPTRGTEACGP